MDRHPRMRLNPSVARSTLPAMPLPADLDRLPVATHAQLTRRLSVRTRTKPGHVPGCSLRAARRAAAKLSPDATPDEIEAFAQLLNSHPAFVSGCAFAASAPVRQAVVRLALKRLKSGHYDRDAVIAQAVARMERVISLSPSDPLPGAAIGAASMSS